jgi:MarR family transcriptional regulator for hemolysin
MGVAVETVEAPPQLCEDLCWLLSKASHSLTTEMTAALERVGVSPRAYCVLTSAMRGEYTQTQLARMVDLDKTTMVVTLDELEAAGLAERRPSAADRRARVIAVTAAGRRKVRQAEEITEGIRQDVLGALEPEERDAFLAALTRLVRERFAQPVACAQPVRRARSRG